MPADRWGERLTRRLGLWSAVAVLVGSTIGSGIFRTPASVAQRIDDVPLFLLAWSAWRLGDVRLARAAADDVLAQDSGHRAATLLAALLLLEVEPGTLPSLAGRPAASASAS